MSDFKTDVSERSVHISIQNQQSNHPLLPPNSKKSEKMLDRRKRNKVFIYFCIGFILSTIIALIAYGLTQGIFEIYESMDNNSDKSTTVSHTTELPITTSMSSTYSEMSTTDAETTTKIPDVDTKTIVEKTNSTSCKRIVGYYSADRKITEKQIEKLTHLIFNAVQMKSDGTIWFQSHKMKEWFSDVKNKRNKIRSDMKIMFFTSAYLVHSKDVFSLMADPKTRKIWIDSITTFIIDHQFDGVDLYYDLFNTEEDKESYMLFCQELRYSLTRIEKEMNRQSSYIISIVTPSYAWPEDNGMDLNELLKYADFLNVQTDNYYVPWHSDKLTGPFSPLYSSNDQNKKKSIDWTLNAYTCKTKMPSKLNIIIPFRAASWKNVGNSETAKDAVYKITEATDNLSLAWRDLGKHGWNVTNFSWHNDSMTPYIWESKNRTLLTFENERSLKEKMKYVIEKNLGGVTIFLLDYDDDSNTLLNAVTSIDKCSGNLFAKDEIKYKCKDIKT